LETLSCSNSWQQAPAGASDIPLHRSSTVPVIPVLDIQAAIEAASSAGKLALVGRDWARRTLEADQFGPQFVD
jgi:hypothetical protein